MYDAVNSTSYLALLYYLVVVQIGSGLLINFFLATVLSEFPDFSLVDASSNSWSHALDHTMSKLETTIKACVGRSQQVIPETSLDSFIETLQCEQQTLEAKIGEAERNVQNAIQSGQQQATDAAQRSLNAAKEMLRRKQHAVLMLNVRRARAALTAAKQNVGLCASSPMCKTGEEIGEESDAQPAQDVNTCQVCHHDSFAQCDTLIVTLVQRDDLMSPVTGSGA